uniref:Peptidase A1 domain-containing protein n=1 Tax=Hanusia phi TaxID=3032 RepID=A0A7S0F2U4_9CRYP|mmetsp:Transcript_36910/g.83228  ORF Transcript_36910/g.83228 Transcript_36910/m.83228 type:complete len:549 (+) Transcript_36910:234-1880(+)
MHSRILCIALLSLLVGAHAKVVQNAMDDATTGSKKQMSRHHRKQSLDSHFWHQGGETYGNHIGRYFRPSYSSTFSLIKLNNVNVTFLDNTNLRGYDGADMATLGRYSVMTRMGMIEHCNSRNFDDVDGILGFGWADQPRSAALLKTLTQPSRPSWNIFDQPFAGDGVPMPRKFAFTANNELGELQLGGYDPAMLSEDFTMFHMTGENVYGIDIHSITYGGVELLHFGQANHKKAFVGEFDSGTTCLLLPNTDVQGNFTTSPFGILAREQAKGERHPLLYKTRDIHGVEHTYAMSYTECVEPTDETMILGDPFFRKWVVLHDLTDLSSKKMGLAPKNPSYQLGAATDRSILTPNHAPHQLTFKAHKNHQPVTKIHARRKMRDQNFVHALSATKQALKARFTELAEPIDSIHPDKVAVKSQQMVTYNIQLAIGSPPQPLDVIFDTGSFMLAVFAEPPPEGMKPLGLGDKSKKSHKLANKPHHPYHHVVEEGEPVELAARGQTFSMSYGSSSLLFVVCAVCVASIFLVLQRRNRRKYFETVQGNDSSYGSC